MHAFLVIDVQTALMSGAFRETEVLDAMAAVTAKVRSSGGLIVYIQHCHDRFEAMMKGAPGWALHPALDVREEDLRVEKTASDAFYQTNLQQLLQEAGVDHLLIAGLQTEFCVDATCRAALSRDYAVTLVADGHTTGDGVLPAADVIKQHNYALGYLAHPDARIQVESSADIEILAKE